MSVVFTILAVGLAFSAAHIRVKNAHEVYQKAQLMTVIAEKIKCNYETKLLSVFEVCGDVLKLNTSSNLQEFKTNLKICLGVDCKEFYDILFSLTSARFDEINDMTEKLKTVSEEYKTKKLNEYNAVKSSAYVFYPGITCIFALLML